MEPKDWSDTGPAPLGQPRKTTKPNSTLNWFPFDSVDLSKPPLDTSRQYLAALPCFDGPEEDYEFVVVEPEYSGGYLCLKTDTAEVEPTEVAFLALLGS